MSKDTYIINKDVSRPILFRGFQAQYIGYLGIGCVGLLIGFAVLYLLGVHPFVCVLLTAGAGGSFGWFLQRLSARFGEYGWMKRMALRRIPKIIPTQAIDERLPLMGVEHDCLLSKQGDITLAFALTLPEIFTLSQGDYETLHQAWIKAIKVLPKHSVLHKQDWFRQTGFRPDMANTERSFLSRSSDRFFLERPFLDHDCYLFLTKKPEGRRPSSSAFSNLLRRSIVPEQTLDRRMLHAFLDSTGQFCRILQDTGLIGIERLEEKDLLGAGGGGRPDGAGRSGLVERYCFLQSDPAGRVLRDLSLDNGLRVGDLHCQLYTLADASSLPAICGPRVRYDKYSIDQSNCSVSFGAALGQLLPCNHLYNQYIFLEDPEQTIRQLEGKRRRLQSLSAQSRSNAVARQGVEAFLNEAVGEQRLPVKAHFNILVWAEDKEDLKDLRNRVTASLSQLDAGVKLETVGAPQIFWAGIPGNAGDFPMNDTFDTFTEQAVCFLNEETRYRSSFSPVGLRLGDRQTGVPVHVDISDEPVQRGYCANRNKFILGPSGSGKSFFTNHMVRTYYEQGTHIVLVDVGHSYEGLCTLVGGTYFTYSESHPICFNPFYLESGEYPDPEKKESIKTLLLALWKREDETFLRSEYVALSNALQAYYAHLVKHPGFACFNSFYTFLRDDFAVALKADRVKDKDFDMDNFLYVLRPYYEGGEYDYLLNARENLDLLDQRFIVFEIDVIKDNPILFPVVTIIIMELFVAKMRKLKGVRKMILIEEAWKAIAREGMAEYIQYLFKTVRKFYGEAVVVTQEVDDIISSPVVKQAIINNSDCKILLDQSKYQNKFDAIQELLGLSDKEKTQVLSLNRANDPSLQYKEVFISLGGRLSKVYRTEVSPEEYMCYTTEEKEKVEVMEYAGRYGDMKRGIRALLAERRGLLPGILLGLGLLGRCLFGLSLLGLVLLTPGRAAAQIPVVSLIRTVVKKVIVAMDLEVQQARNQTLALQNAQKARENDMSSSELGDIQSWVQKQEDLYREYYAELDQVKAVLAGFEEVKGIIDKEARSVQQYQMTDGQRLELIDRAVKSMDRNLSDLQRINRRHDLLSLQRAREQQEVAELKQLYGLP
jgi:conjugation system TraG family ATPase